MTTSSTLYWTNFTQPDEGREWTNSASFLAEDEAKKAAKALTSEAVQAATYAVVEVFDGTKKIARYEYDNGSETLIYDDRVEPLFTFHGKLSSIS